MLASSDNLQILVCVRPVLVGKAGLTWPVGHSRAGQKECLSFIVAWISPKKSRRSMAVKYINKSLGPGASGPELGAEDLSHGVRDL